MDEIDELDELDDFLTSIALILFKKLRVTLVALE